MLKSNRDQISSMTHADRMNAFAVFALLLNFLSISSCFAQNDIVLHEIIKHSLSSKKELCSTHAKYNLNFKIEDASSQPYSFIFDLALKPKCAKSSCTSCSNVGEGNTLPVVLTNNFLRRTSVSEELSPSSYAFGENGVELDCPFGMNLVLWPLGDTVAEVSLRDNRVSGVLSDFSIDPSISLFKPIAEYNRTTPFLCDGRHSVDVAVTTLRANQYVYIPHQFSAAIKSTGGQEGSMFASCVVDGSNYNDVVERLASNDVQEAAHKLRMELMATSLDRKMALNPVEVSVKEYISRNQAINVVGSSSSESTAPASPVDAEAEMPPRSEDDKRRSRRKRRGGEYKQWQEQATWDSIIASRTIAPIANISVSSVERFRVEVAIGESVEFWRTHFIGQRAGLKMRLCSLRDAALLFNNIMFSDVDSAQWSFVSDEWLASSCVEREFASTDWLLSNSEGTVHFYVESLAPDTLYQFQVRRYVDSNSSVWSHWTPPFRTAPLEAPRASNATIGVRCLDRSPELSIRSTAIKDLDATRILSPALQLEVEWSKDNGGDPIISYKVYTRGVTVEASSFEWSLAFVARSPFVECNPGRHCFEAYNIAPTLSTELTVRACNKLGCSSYFPPASLSSNVIAKCWRGLHSCDLTNSVLVGQAESHKGEEDAMEAIVTNKDIALDMCPLILDITAQRAWVTMMDANGNMVAESMTLWKSHWGTQCGIFGGQYAFLDENDSHVHNKIAIATRNGTALFELAMSAQRAGAIAVVIVDDGQCKDFDQHCLPGSSKRFNEGFASEDTPKVWEQLFIPAALVLNRDKLLLRSRTPPLRDSPIHDEL